MKEMVLPAETDSLYQILDFVRKFAQTHGFQEEVFQIELATEEVFTNIVSYAYGSKSGTVRVVCRVEVDTCADKSDNGKSAANRLQICFMDKGIVYNPLKQENPDITFPVDLRPVGGLGVFLVKEFMDHIFYEYREGTNILTIEKCHNERKEK